ncbi:MOSC domain-containing protein [Jeotgalibacillus marinus]|uniref:MOSC domain-containing protein n=1 Tax=Jeotgalibacillus marinus TaxID=86667 RepID=A0ABV3Q518_9BACL
MQQTTYKVKSINLGKIETLTFGDKTFETAIRKQAITEPAFITKLGLVEDEQAFEHHGGTEKALCLYPYDYYAFWSDLLGHLEGPALFGENLSTLGLTEKNTHIGDAFKLGEAVIQVTEPRQPCYKLAAKYGVPDMVVRMRDSGYTGFLFRVLQEGWVSPEDHLELIEQHPHHVTVSFANDVKFSKKPSKEAIETILAVDALSVTLRESLMKKLNKVDE